MKQSNYSKSIDNCTGTKFNGLQYFSNELIQRNIPDRLINLFMGVRILSVFLPSGNLNFIWIDENYNDSEYQEGKTACSVVVGFTFVYSIHRFMFVHLDFTLHNTPWTIFLNWIIISLNDSYGSKSTGEMRLTTPIVS